MSRRLYKNIIFFSIALFFIIYFYIQVKNIFIDTMETEYATVSSMDEIVELKCYIVRDEKVLDSHIGGTYNYVVSEGEKLAEGQTVTTIYTTDSEYRTQEQIQEINSKISILNDSSVEHNYFTVSVDKIDDKVHDLITDYKSSIVDGDFSLAVQNKNELLTTLNKRYLVVNALTGFDSMIAEYETQKQKLMSRVSGDMGTVEASVPGYFFSDVDGYENILTPNLLKTGTVDEIINALNSEPEKASLSTVGKIVSEYEWYTVCVVDKDTALKFQTNTTYEVSYPYSVGTTIECKLHNKIVQSDSDKVVLVFISNTNLNSFNFMRSQIIQVKLNTYSGLRIKKEALRIVDNNEGVYILEGNTVKFKRAHKIYENDGYYMITPKDPLKDTENEYDYLEMYDAVINNGKELYDGKTIG